MGAGGGGGGVDFKSIESSKAFLLILIKPCISHLKLILSCMLLLATFGIVTVGLLDFQCRHFRSTSLKMWMHILP